MQTCSRPDLLERLGELEGKTLACWCAVEDGRPHELTAEEPTYCHGQIIIRLIEELLGPAPSNPLLAA